MTRSLSLSGACIGNSEPPHDTLVEHYQPITAGYHPRSPIAVTYHFAHIMNRHEPPPVISTPQMIAFGTPKLTNEDEHILAIEDTTRINPLKTALRYITKFVKFFVFTSRLLYLTTLCTIWELPSILTQSCISILRRAKTSVVQGISYYISIN